MRGRGGRAQKEGELLGVPACLRRQTTSPSTPFTGSAPPSASHQVSRFFRRSIRCCAAGGAPGNRNRTRRTCREAGHRFLAGYWGEPSPKGRRLPCLLPFLHQENDATSCRALPSPSTRTKRPLRSTGPPAHLSRRPVHTCGGPGRSGLGAGKARPRHHHRPYPSHDPKRCPLSPRSGKGSRKEAARR